MPMRQRNAHTLSIITLLYLHFLMSLKTPIFMESLFFTLSGGTCVGLKKPQG